MNNDLKLIKKYYGEKFSHLCRDLFPTILEKPGVLYNIILNSFYPNKFLYDDIINNKLEIEFKNYTYFIYNKTKVKNNQNEAATKTPFELMDEAGYVLYECKTEEDIQSFKKYYAFGEKLCTFNGGRLDNCYVFFAVKKNVNEIKREDFTNPSRQDLYGTSVISIQFTKDEYNIPSIKNRYNHTVVNPDATFSNNLDNIIPGLTEAFNRYYQLNIKNEQHNFEIPNYVRANDGKLYKYNYETRNNYFCPNNIIIDNYRVKKYDRAKYIVFDNYILDIQELKIIDSVRAKTHSLVEEDCFALSIGNFKKVEQRFDKNTNTRRVIIDDSIIIELDNLNQMISYINPKIKEIGNRFLIENKTLLNISLPNVKKIGNFFLYYNRKLKNVNLPKVKIINDYFLTFNCEITSISLPELTSVGADFMRYDNNLIDVNIPKLKRADREPIDKYLNDPDNRISKVKKITKMLSVT